MSLEKKSKNRISVVLVGGLFLAMFVLINAQQFLIAAFIYIVMGVLSLFLYTQWGKISKVGDLEGIDKNWVSDAFWGFVLAVITIILGKFIGFIGAIGIPPVQSIAGTVGRFIIVVPSAMIFETVFFQDFLQDFFDSKLRFPKLLSLLLTASAFALFHLAAYGQSLQAAGGSFLSAGIMGFIFGIVSERQNSLAGTIIYHGVLNAWIGFISLAVIIT